MNFKKEFNFDDDDGWENDGQEDKCSMDPKETTQDMSNCPINMFKDESDNDDKDEQEMPTENFFDSVLSNDEKDVIGPDSVAPNVDSNLQDKFSDGNFLFYLFTKVCEVNYQNYFSR